MGAADLCPGVPGHRAGGRRARRLPGNLPAGVPRPPGFKGQAKFSSWLYRIALNLCRDWIRRKRRTPVSQLPGGRRSRQSSPPNSGPAESVEDLVARRELSAVVEEAMALLPEEQRTAIILKEYHGMTFQEIADLQGCPLSTVKTRLYQGLSVLRKHLRDETPSPMRSRRCRRTHVE